MNAPDTVTDRVSRALTCAKDDPQGAFKLLVSAVDIDPASATAWYHLGLQYQAAKQFASSAVCFRRALENSPPMPPEQRAMVLTNLGYNLHLSGRTAEGLPFLEEATQIAPQMPLGWIDISQMYGTLERRDDAMKAALKAAMIAPEDPKSQMTLAFALLFAGNWADGFKHYTARFRFRMPDVLNYPYPQWDGKPVDTLFMISEQGIGDTLMMSRFISEAASRAQKVIFFCHKEARTILECNVPLNVELHAMPAPMPKADAFVPLMTLPHVLGMTADDLVTKYRAPYIGSPVNWERRGKPRKGLNVGIVWGGDPKHDSDQWRSIPAAEFIPLSEVSGVTLYSLQVGERAEDLGKCGMHGLVRDMSPEITNFSDTARIVADLDLVIACDTSVVHLCGAMNKPVWVLINKQCTDWRWGPSGETTPWYPSATVFRKELHEEWRNVMRRVADRLAALDHANKGT